MLNSWYFKKIVVAYCSCDYTAKARDVFTFALVTSRHQDVIDVLIDLWIIFF
jgi:hypothetical protein